jgi:hypothetical protein
MMDPVGGFRGVLGGDLDGGFRGGLYMPRYSKRQKVLEKSGQPQTMQN